MDFLSRFSFSTRTSSGEPIPQAPQGPEVVEYLPLAVEQGYTPVNVDRMGGLAVQIEREVDHITRDWHKHMQDRQFMPFAGFLSTGSAPVAGVPSTVILQAPFNPDFWIVRVMTPSLIVSNASYIVFADEDSVSGGNNLATPAIISPNAVWLIGTTTVEGKRIIPALSDTLALVIVTAAAGSTASTLYNVAAIRGYNPTEVF